MKMKSKTWVVSVALVAVCLLCLGGVSARAQDRSKVDFSVDYSYIAHSLTAAGCSGGSFISCVDPGLQGFKIAGAWNLNDHLGVQCDAAYHAGNHTINAYAYTESGSYSYQSSTRESDNITTYTCGPKVTERVGNFELFANFGAGAMHVFEGEISRYAETPTEGTATAAISSEGSVKGTIFGMEVGGGVDWVHHRWGIRLLEVDYVHGTGTLNGHCTINCGTTVETFTGIGKANDVQIAMGVDFRFGKK